MTNDFHPFGPEQTEEGLQWRIPKYARNNSYKDAFGVDGEWTNVDEYKKALDRMRMTPYQMAREFRKTFGQPLDVYLTEDQMFGDDDNDTMAFQLICEEYNEAEEAYLEEQDLGSEALLKELADLVYVVYGYAAFRGWNLDKAVSRVHMSNMSKCDPVTGEPIRREDGKILKGGHYKPPYLKDLV